MGCGRAKWPQWRVHMPLYACEHFYILTKPLPEIQALGQGAHLPTLNDQDAFLYARDDVEGLLVGKFEPHAKGCHWSVFLPFSFDLLDEIGTLHAMMENALRRIPANRPRCACCSADLASRSIPG